MFDLLCYPLLQSGVAARTSTIFGLFILALCLAFFWFQWKMIRAYRSFPSKRLDIEWILPIILGRYPKDVSFTNFVFNIIMEAVNTFRKEGLCVLWFLTPYVIVFKSEFMKDLVNEDSLADKPMAFDISKLIFGNGILRSNHEQWKVQRKWFNPAFSAGILKSKISSMNKYALQLVEKFEMRVDKPVDDAEEVLKFCAFQNVLDFLLDFELDNERRVSLAKRAMKLTDDGERLFVEKLFHPWLHWDFLLPFFGFGKKYLKLIHDINRLFHEVIDEAKKKGSTEKEQRKDDSQISSSFWDILMRLERQHDDFTEKDIRDHFASFLSAGHGTVFLSMLYCLYALGHNPEVQEKAHNEVMSIEPKGDVTYEDLAELKYLDCVIKETMRIYPTIPLFGRKAGKDIQCGKYVIPKGSEVVFHTAMLHRDPNVFPEPEKFDPERFSSGSQLRPWMYLPFAEGYRNCIGKKFAMIEMKVHLVHILRRFRIVSLNKFDESELDWTIALKPTKPLRFLFEKRRENF